MPTHTHAHTHARKYSYRACIPRRSELSQSQSFSHRLPSPPSLSPVPLPCALVPLPSHSPIPSLPLPQLPFNDAPEAFGLHENANITSAINETNLLLGTALSLQPKSAEGVGLSWDQMLTQLSVDIESRLPALFDNAQGDIDFPVRYDESMNTVLTQELLRFNNLTARLKVGCDEMARCHAVHLNR